MHASAGDIGNLDSGNDRRTFFHSIHAEQSGNADVVDVVPGFLTVWSILPISGNRAIDQPRIDLIERFITDAQTIHDTRAESLYNDIDTFGQFQKYLTSDGMLEI